MRELKKILLVKHRARATCVSAKLEQTRMVRTGADGIEYSETLKVASNQKRRFCTGLTAEEEQLCGHKQKEKGTGAHIHKSWTTNQSRVHWLRAQKNILDEGKSKTPFTGTQEADLENSLEDLLGGLQGDRSWHYIREPVDGGWGPELETAPEWHNNYHNLFQ